MTLWLYTRVIRPIITYGAVAWWTRTKQKGTIRLLNSTQRLACLSVTGALSTTPTAALEVILNIPPLHIFIQGEARSVTYRLMQGQTPIIRSHGKTHKRLEEELNANPITGMPSDALVKKYNFEKKYKVLTPQREDWDEGPPTKAESNWYTDGSKTDKGVGAGIYGKKPETKISVSLTKDTTVFQAEAIAVHLCTKEIARQDNKSQSVAIFSDSQALLKALSNTQVDSKLVWDCVSALNELGSHKKVTLTWIPGHKGHPGNDKADELAKQGSSEAFIGPEPSCGIAKTTIRRSIKNWMETQARTWWTNAPGQRQARQFLKNQSPKLTTDLLNQDRKMVKTIVGLITGHCRLNKHMSKIGLAEDALCRFCLEEEEDPFHILCQCEGLARIRYLKLGTTNPSAESYTQDTLAGLIELIKEAKLEQVI